MARPGRIKELEQRMGESSTLFIPRQVKAMGSIFQAAVSLNLTPNAIHNWMKTHGYVLVDGELRKKEQAS